MPKLLFQQKAMTPGLTAKLKRLNRLPRTSKTQKRWQELRRELQTRLKAFEAELNELNKTKRWRRAMALRTAIILRRKTRAGMAPEESSRIIVTSKDVLKSLSLQINILTLKIKIVHPRGLIRTGSKAGEIARDLEELIDIRDDLRLALKGKIDDLLRLGLIKRAQDPKRKSDAALLAAPFGE